MRITVIPLIALAACTFDQDSPPGGQCVPGQAVQCWCDGVTPGVQQCEAPDAYGPCMCDGTGTGGLEDGTTGGSESSTGQEPGLDTTAGPGSSTGAADGGTTSTGEPPPTECTDMDFAFWQACRSLASLENPSPCEPCTGNTCETAQCSLDCAALGNPGLDAAYAACDAAYPFCPDVWPDPNPYSECVFGCYEPYNACLVAALPTCENDSVLACLTILSECQAAC